jgi:3-dehydroquinate synthase
MRYDSYMQHMQHDKKVVDSRIRFILPTTIGNAIVTDDVAMDTLQSLLA